MSKEICGEGCEECLICKGQRLCCLHDHNNGYHGCVRWKRKPRPERKPKLEKKEGSDGN